MRFDHGSDEIAAEPIELSERVEMRNDRGESSLDECQPTGIHPPRKGVIE